MTDISPEPQEDATPSGVEPDETPDEETADDGDPRLAKVRQEAKNLRSRLRETETERDGLRASLNAYNHAEATAAAEDLLADGEDLFRDGVELADLLGEDGTVDEALVHEAARLVIEKHPHWSRGERPGPVPGLTPGMGHAESSGGWQKVLQGKH